MQKKLILSILILLLALSCLLWSTPNSVPVGDPVYAFLDRMETLGHLHTVQDGIKPYSRTKVAAFLEQLQQVADQLTPIDRRRLQDLLLDYRRELQPGQTYHRTTEGQNWYSVLGKLQSYAADTLSDGRKIYPDKWLAAQRLELTLWQQLTLGLNENFIYGDRYVDWAYFFPLNFYRATQHKLRDRDNATISVDMEWIARPGIKLYGTDFIV